MMKKIIALMLSLLCFFVIGCGGSGKPVTVLEGESKIIRLYVGQEGEFKNANYSYTSDNESVLSIRGNTYKGLKEGSASVTVEDGKGGVAVYLFTVFGNEPVELENLTIQNIPEGNSITVGESATLSFEKQPVNADKYDAIVWESSDSSILSVDKRGNIVANGMGQATITISALGTNVKSEILLNVLPRDTVFKLNYSKVIGVLGSAEDLLVANVLTDYPIQKEVSWFTSDASIVTVNNGRLTFVKEGTANVGISARINDTEYSAICEVIVQPDEGFTVIRSAEQLQEIGNASGNYMLGNDIDFANACAPGGSLYNDGKGFMPLFEDAENAFTGIFEGNGFAIRNIMINRPNDAFVAIMSYISAKSEKAGVIRNLAVIGGSIKGANYTSVFFANCSGYGNVESGLENCYAELNISSTGSASGLVGNNKGIVKNCVSNVTFDALGKVCLFALNHTIPSDSFGVMNCVYVGESVNSTMANTTNGGFMTNCFAITLAEVAEFNFELGDGWNYTDGQIPTIKG